MTSKQPKITFMVVLKKLGEYAAILTAVWFLFEPLVDGYVQERIDDQHRTEHEEEAKQKEIKVIWREGDEFYINQSGEHRVVLREDGRRQWYNKDRWELVYN